MTIPQVLDDYESMSIGEAITMCRDLVEDPDFPTVKRWRDSGAGRCRYSGPERRTRG